MFTCVSVAGKISSAKTVQDRTVVSFYFGSFSQNFLLLLCHKQCFIVTLKTEFYLSQFILLLHQL